MAEKFQRINLNVSVDDDSVTFVSPADVPGTKGFVTFSDDNCMTTIWARNHDTMKRFWRTVGEKLGLFEEEGQDD